MARSALFTNPEAWTPPYYELDLELGTDDDDELVDAARVLWNHPDLDGPYADNTRDPADQTVVDPAVLADDVNATTKVYGLATPPDGARVPCGSLVTRFDEGGTVLLLFFPVGGLDLVYGVDFARPEYWGPWASGFDAWLEDVARFVHIRSPIAFASIAEEGVGVTQPGLRRLVPTERGDLRWDNGR
jgi:hypothetical protein